MLLILLFCSLQAAATSVLPVPLQRMAKTAEMIFHGTAIGNEVRLDQASGRVATYTSFKVIEVIKGDPGEIHTIKQIGGELPGSNVRQVIHGVPRFAVGEEYVIFLPEPSSLGFASPIGLSQGKFDIHKLNGQAVITNKRQLAELDITTPQQALPSMPTAIAAGPAQAQPATMHLADFLQTVHGMVRE